VPERCVGREVFVLCFLPAAIVPVLDLGDFPAQVRNEDPNGLAVNLCSVTALFQIDAFSEAILTPQRHVLVAGKHRQNVSLRHGYSVFVGCGCRRRGGVADDTGSTCYNDSLS